MSPDISSRSSIEQISGLYSSPLPVLFVLQDLIERTTGLYVSNLSMNGWSAPWYMPLTQFETVFLCLWMFKIFILRYIEILPININNFFHGDPTGRKRRSLKTLIKSANSSCDSRKDGGLLVSLIQKMDNEQCFLQSLCLISSASNTATNNEYANLKVPTEIGNLVLFLQRRIDYIQNNVNFSKNVVPDPMEDCGRGLKPFEDAVNIGSVTSNSTTTCEESYRQCPLQRDDITHYLNLIFELSELNDAVDF